MNETDASIDFIHEHDTEWATHPDHDANRCGYCETSAYDGGSCTYCDGTGRIGEWPCSECQGHGYWGYSW